MDDITTKGMTASKEFRIELQMSPDDSRIDLPGIMYDFGNRENHPYSEFPKGLKITSIEENGDSTTIEGDYAKSYKKTEVSC